MHTRVLCYVVTDNRASYFPDSWASRDFGISNLKSRDPGNFPGNFTRLELALKLLYLTFHTQKS